MDGCVGGCVYMNGWGRVGVVSGWVWWVGGWVWWVSGCGGWVGGWEKTRYSRGTYECIERRGLYAISSVS